MTENTSTAETTQSPAPIQTKSPKSKWRIIHDFIKKTDAAELVILKAISHEPSDDVSLDCFDTLTKMAINTCLDQDVKAAGIEDVADMLAHRINNAFALTQKLAKIVSGKHLSRLQQVLMAAAKSKAEAKAAYDKLSRI